MHTMAAAMGHGSAISPPERKKARDAPRTAELRLHAARGLNLAKSKSERESTVPIQTGFQPDG